MHKGIRSTLVILALVVFLPASTGAEGINVEESEQSSCPTCSDCEIESGCSDTLPASDANIYENFDSLSWEGGFDPVLDAGPSGSWDERAVIGPEVLYTGTQYLMWYTGITGTIYQTGFATSYNGLTWEKSTLNPVLAVGEPGSWDEKKAWAPAVLYNPPLWQMWYVGYSDATGSQIGYATSQDGIHWEKYAGNPVLSPGIFDEWESYGVNAPFVMFEDGIYHMWYSSDPDGSIGYAASADGIHWERHPRNPVIESWGGDPENCSPVKYVSPTVVHLGEYHMWYQEGESCRGGISTYLVVHSTSPDRVTWSDPELAYGIGTVWNAHYPTVISHHNGLLKQMWYVNYGNIYYAEENLLDQRKFIPLAMR